MLTRSSVLGKRGHQVSSMPALSVESCEQLQTPDSTPNPKRARTTTSVEDGDANKENIPPFRLGSVTAPTTPRSARAMRRHATSAEVVTPTRIRAALRRTASASSLMPATPAAEKSELTILTPPSTPPAILLPLHARIRALLRSTCNNAQIDIDGRETERASILEFITPFIENATAAEVEYSSLFISGSPGTGKTALVNAIVREISAAKEADVKVVSINCMALKSVDALWERMIEELTAGAKQKTTNRKIKGREMVQSILNSLKLKCILILDELDHIASTPQALSSIFTLTESVPIVLRLIGIANTHTLTSSSCNALAPSSNVQTIHFAPYTPTQLQSVLQSRLNTLCEGEASAQTTADIKKLLPAPTLMLLTKKIAALTGDVRSLFEVLRGAIDLAITVDNPSDEVLLSSSIATTTPKHVLAALKAYTPSAPSAAPATTSTAGTAGPSNSETVTKIHNLGLQARLVLLTIILASKRLETGLSLTSSLALSPKKASASPMKRTSSLPNTPVSKPGVGIETGVLHTYYTAVLGRSEMGIFEPVSRSEFGDLLGVLEGVGIVSLSSSLSPSSSPSGKGRKPFGRSSSFGAGLSKSSAGAVGEVRLVEGMWSDEVLRGLGVSNAAELSVDAREEEVRGIWRREQARLARDVKASIARTSDIDTFLGASQD